MRCSSTALMVVALARSAVAAAPQPHIVLVVIDDYGWNDIGFHAKTQSNANEILTPTFDSLAAEGVLLDRHYVFRFCSPTRSALLTGRNPIHVNVLNSDLAAANTSDPISGFAGLPRNISTVAEKLASVGYQTVQAGKWHLGLATPDHTPHGRGFAASLSYLDGANDYWTSNTGDWCANGATDLFASEEPAYGMNNSLTCSQSHQPASCRYEDDIFTNFTLNAIRAHDASKPLFLYFAPHSVHLPLQVPDAQLAKFNFIVDSEPRQHYAAMTNYVDMHVGQIVTELKARGMWENTLLVLSSDNGGPIFGQAAGCKKCDGSAGASNYPLKGGKHSSWEGGVRVNAFISGGFVPPAVRGTVAEGLVAVEDWLATFCALAGVDPTDERAAAAGLPPIDSLDQWPYLSGSNKTSPRTEVWLGADSPVGGEQDAAFVQGLITSDGGWKLLHDLVYMDVYSGPLYPNASTAAHPWDNTPMDCGTIDAPMCLYNVFTDPSERSNVASSHPDIVAKMAARIKELQATVFSPRRGNPSPKACEATRTLWHGFVGPFLP